MSFYATSTRDLIIPVFPLDLLPFKMGSKVYGPKMAKMYYSKFAIHEIFISAVHGFRFNGSAVHAMVQPFNGSSFQRFTTRTYGSLPEPLEYF